MDALTRAAIGQGSIDNALEASRAISEFCLSGPIPSAEFNILVDLIERTRRQLLAEQHSTLEPITISLGMYVMGLLACIWAKRPNAPSQDEAKALLRAFSAFVKYLEIAQIVEGLDREQLLLFKSSSARSNLFRRCRLARTTHPVCFFNSNLLDCGWLKCGQDGTTKRLPTCS